MTITLKIRPLDRKVRTSVYLVKSRRGKLRNGEKVCLGKPIEKDGRFNYAVYKVNDANSVVGNLGNITTDQRDLSGEENKFQKLNELDESVWNELDSARPSPAEPDSTGASPKSDPARTNLKRRMNRREARTNLKRRTNLNRREARTNPSRLQKCPKKNEAPQPKSSSKARPAPRRTRGAATRKPKKYCL